MYERDLNNHDSNDAVVTIPPASPPAEDQGQRTECYRSQVRRDGTTSLEIEIPRRGITDCERWISVGVLMFFSTFLLIGIPLAPTLILMNGVGDLPFLLFIVIPGLAILGFPSSMMEAHFTQVNLKITRDNYGLTLRGITWKSLFRIMCLPSHFNDFESGQFVEAAPKVSQYVRRRALQARIVTHHNNKSVTKDIKLGSISFARGLDNEELEWLVEEINSFFRETRS